MSGCGCTRGPIAAFFERFFGRQLHDSGTVAGLEVTGRDSPIYFPTNPLEFKPELSIVGYSYGPTDFGGVPPEYAQKGYAGVFPIAEQPKIEFPQPYDVPVF